MQTPLCSLLVTYSRNLIQRRDSVLNIELDGFPVSGLKCRLCSKAFVAGRFVWHLGARGDVSFLVFFFSLRGDVMVT